MCVTVYTFEQICGGRVNILAHIILCLLEGTYWYTAALAVLAVVVMTNPDRLP